MQQAGVILSDYARLMVEILKDNASPLADPVFSVTSVQFSWHLRYGPAVVLNLVLNHICVL
jgi:hypothetical protein